MARAATRKPAARKKGASRNSAPARKGVPAALWVVLGLLMGAFVMFLWHLWELRQDSVAKPATSATARKTPAPAADGDPAATASPRPAAEEPRFEFYTLLPSQEVMPGSKPAPAQPEARPDSAGPAFLLQAGSFKSEAEADKRRAAILLLGMPVKVVKIGKDGAPWYRVVVGPFQGKAAADSARTSLKGNGVDSLVIKQG
ncbi:MAG: SPOR domain-containing protein [Pseudomonadota bacterium]